MATQNALNNFGVTQATGDNSTKLATTAYVTTAVANALAGVNPAVAVQAATTANVAGYTYNNGVSGVGATLTQNSAAVVVIDGYTLLLNDRVLFKNQSTAANNGIYFVSTLGTGLVPAVFTRALDYDQPSDMNNTGAIPVVNGTVNAATSWLLTSTVNTVGTDSLTYTQFSLNPTTIQTQSAVRITPITLITSNTTLGSANATVLCDTSGGGFTVTLPAASGSNGWIYNIKKISSDGNTLTIARTGSDVIDGQTSLSITTQYVNAEVQGYAANNSWNIL